MRLFCFLIIHLAFCFPVSKGQVAVGDSAEAIINSEILEKYQNATEPSYLYIVQLELKASRVDESFLEIEKRLDKLVGMAFVLAAYKHRKQVPPTEISTADLGYSTKIIRKRTNGENTFIHFVAYAANEPVLGEVVADDMKLLTLSQISATLRYPLRRIVSDRDIENESATKWWFLIAVVGAGVILILVGWFFLFLFYNTCGYRPDDFVNSSRKDQKELIIDFASDHFELSADQPIAVIPSDGSNPISRGKPKLKKKVRNLAPPPIEKETKDDAFNKERAAAPLEPTSFGPLADTKKENTADVEVARGEKKRRHTKIGPITSTTLTTTNEHDDGVKRARTTTSEISRARKSVSMSSSDGEDGVGHGTTGKLTDTGLKLYKKSRKNEPKSDPESDYGSSLDDDKPKKVVGPDWEEDTKSRPKSAKKQRTSLFGGDGIAPIPSQPRAWTVYSAGDRLSEFWNYNILNNHPTPSSPSESGVVEVKSSRASKF